MGGTRLQAVVPLDEVNPHDSLERAF